MDKEAILESLSKDKRELFQGDMSGKLSKTLHTTYQTISIKVIEFMLSLVELP